MTQYICLFIHPKYIQKVGTDYRYLIVCKRDLLIEFYTKTLYSINKKEDIKWIKILRIKFDNKILNNKYNN